MRQARAMLNTPGTTASGTGPLLPYNYRNNGLGSNWNIASDNEFNGNSLDTTVFSPFWFFDHNTQNGTVMDAANVSVSNGSLNLLYTAGGHGAIISSNPSGGATPGFEFVYGYAEARINLPDDGSGGLGQWTAFWITGQNWPVTGEIDIQEANPGNGFYYHYGNTAPGFSVNGTAAVTPGWHIFGANWEPGIITFFVDGLSVGTIQNSDLNPGFSITSSPLYVVCEIATGVAGLAPSTSLVDYIRVWQIPTAPSNQVPPHVTGTAAVGSILTSDTGTWSGLPPITTPPPTWWHSANQVNWVQVGASSLNYQILNADNGDYIQSRVTASNSVGSTIQASNNVGPVTNPLTPPVNTVLPVISGTPLVGNILSTSSGIWTGNPTPTFTYQWQTSANNSTWANINGETNSTYTIATAVGTFLHSVITAHNSQGTPTATSSGVQVSSIPLNTTPPVVTGTTTTGQTLTTSTGVWSGVPSPTLQITWQTSGTNTGPWTNTSDTTTTYLLVDPADAGQFLRTSIQGSNSMGAAVAVSNVTAQIHSPPVNKTLPVISDTTPIQGQTISTTNGTWTGVPTPTFTYLWQSSSDGGTNWGAPAGPATGSTYICLAADANNLLRMRITGANSVSSVTVNSAATAAVVGIPIPVNSPPVIS